MHGTVTHALTAEACSVPSITHTRPCSGLSVRTIDWVPKRRPSLLKNIERGRSLISFFFYFQEISQQLVFLLLHLEAMKNGQKYVLLYF